MQPTAKNLTQDHFLNSGQFNKRTQDMEDNQLKRILVVTV